MLRYRFHVGVSSKAVRSRHRRDAVRRSQVKIRPLVWHADFVLAATLRHEGRLRQDGVEVVQGRSVYYRRFTSESAGTT